MAAKKLVVDLDYNTPQFDFVGDWSGKDIRIVIANIRRAYLKLQRDLRVQATGNMQAELAPQEVS
jgi:hypothetical protein